MFPLGKERVAMKRYVSVLFLLAIVLLFIAVVSSVTADSPGGGARVLNPGEGQLSGSCWYGPHTTIQMSAVRTPRGNATLSCQFEDLPPVPEAVNVKGFGCSLFWYGSSYTTDSKFVHTPSGRGNMICQFNEPYP